MGFRALDTIEVQLTQSNYGRVQRREEVDSTTLDGGVSCGVMCHLPGWETADNPTLTSAC